MDFFHDPAGINPNSNSYIKEILKMKQSLMMDRGLR